MLSVAINNGYSITEVPPAQFVSLCWEAHAVIKPQLAKYFSKILNRERGKLFTVYDANGTMLRKSRS